MPFFVWISERSMRLKQAPFRLGDPAAPLLLSLSLPLSVISNLRCFVQTNASCFLSRKSKTSKRKSGLRHITGNVTFWDFMKNGVVRKESR